MQIRDSGPDQSHGKVSCPSCGAVYRLPTDNIKRGPVRAKCKKCGASFLINDLVKEQNNISSDAKQEPSPSSEEEQYRAKYEYVPVLQRQVPQKGHDPLAILIIAICVAGILFFGFMAYKSFSRGRYLPSVTQLLDNLTRKGFFAPGRKKNTLKNFQKTQERKYLDLLSSGHRYFRKKQYEKAVKLYTAARSLRRDKIEPLYWRARAFQELGKTKWALEDFKTILRIDPKYEKAWSNIGWIYSNLHRWDDALVYLNRAIELNPKNGWAYYNRGRCYYNKGMREKALQDAKKACDLGYDLGCKVYKKYGK